MNRILLTPYTTLKDQVYLSDVVLVIDKENCKGINETKTSSVFNFENCVFRAKVTFECNEVENFEDLSISFFSCYINRIECRPKNSINSKCSIYFGGCIVQGVIEHQNIHCVTFGNSLLCDSFFLIGLSNVSIAYTEENIFALQWKWLIKILQLETLENLFGRYNTNSYYINKCDSVYAYMNESIENTKGIYIDNNVGGNRYWKTRYRLTDSEKEKVNISISLDYANNERINKIVKISNLKLSSLSLRGRFTNDLIIENSKIDNIYIRDGFVAEKSCYFYNIQAFRENVPERKLEINRANLNKVWFDNISFDSYSIISLYRNNYRGFKLSSCSFPLDINDFDKFHTVENIHYIDDKDNNYYRTRYETFLQFRNILEQSDSFYEAQRFKTLSLQALEKIEGLPKWDKTILLINKISNNHGISIGRPLALILCFSIAFYIIYLVTIDRIFIDTQVDYNLIGYYFSFLDITHSLDFLAEKEELSGWSIFIDYLNKIVVGFLLFQFVAAFRKYIRK